MMFARDVSELRDVHGPLAVSVGVFDGVHRGHAAVLRVLRREARREGATALAVTLDPHPREVLHPAGGGVPLLTTPAERARLLAAQGAQRVFVHPFNRAVAELSPEEFLQRLTPPGARLAVLVVGHDFRMGKDRSAGYEELRLLGERRGFRLARVEAARVAGEAVSSSRIRELIRGGWIREAVGLLGHAYPLEGRVVAGRGVGRKLEFPTANIGVDDPRKLLPGFGVYAVRVRIPGRAGPLLLGVMNWGTRPTFGGSQPAIEVHLPDFDGDLLGTALELHLEERIRREQAFGTPQALARRIGEDVEKARRILGIQG